jgi:hypothetical protein
MAARRPTPDAYVDPTRRISVLDAHRIEISTVPVYSKPV